MGGVRFGGFLARLGEGDLDAVLALGHRRRYRAGQYLMLAEDQGDHVMAVLEGLAVIVAPAEDGRELLLAVRLPGDLVGELAAVDPGARRSASVRARTDVEVTIVDGDSFRAALAARPALAMALFGDLAARLREAERRRFDAGIYDTTRRLARLLADLTTLLGRPVGATVEIDVGLSQTDLAGLVASSRESVGRALGELRNRGLVSTGRRAVVVLDLDGLVRLGGRSEPFGRPPTPR